MSDQHSPRNVVFGESRKNEFAPEDAPQPRLIGNYMRREAIASRGGYFSLYCPFCVKCIIRELEVHLQKQGWRITPPGYVALPQTQQEAQAMSAISERFLEDGNLPEARNPT